jgi:hypothetical protein
VVSQRGRRQAAIAATAAGLLLGITACSSGSTGAGTSPGTGQNAASARNAAAPALLAQCAVTADLAGAAGSAAKASDQLPASEQWLHSGKIQLTAASAGQFTGWYEGHLAAVVVHGKSFDQWAQGAASSDKLPTAVCGTTTTASALYAQVYAHYPKLMKSNPWS